MKLATSDTRQLWLNALQTVANPIFSHLAEGTLATHLPVAKGQDRSRQAYAPLEALGRTFAGVAPWLEAPNTGAEEAALQQKMAADLRAGLAHAFDPKSPDFMNFTESNQPLVDASYLALGLIRSRRVIWDQLEAKTRAGLLHCLRETRRIKAPFNNWLLFPAMIEAFFLSVGEEWDPMRVDYAIRQHDQWYMGDGAYGDGPYHHWDYYNSFAIQPFLLEVLRVCVPASPDLQRFQEPMLERARRYAAVQERLIAPDGSFPPLGRSLAYRFGVFHHLAMMALWDKLPDGVSPAQVRCGLTAVLRRFLDARGVFDAKGWLTIGLAGSQPSLGEVYISTGSLYMFCCGFLPLGIAPDYPFWTSADTDWTAKKLWSGQDLPADHCLDDRPNRFLSFA